MKKSIFLVPAIALMSAVSPFAGSAVRQDLNMLTAAEKAAGWKLMFDGKSTGGWHTYGEKTVVDSWKAEGGTLGLDGSTKDRKGGDIVSEEAYSDFDFKVEWKISKNGNSCVMFYVQDDHAKYKSTYFTGPEMQVLDNDGHPDGKIIKHRAGDLYDLISSSSEPVKPVGEWNQAEIISKNGDLKLFLNGVNVVHTTMWDDAWKKMVAGSKFKQWPDFATAKNGHIALQDHGNDVWFRNIKIRKL